MAKKRLNTVTYSTEEAVWNIASSLVKDLLPKVRDPEVHRLGLLFQSRQLKEIRLFMEGYKLNLHAENTEAFKAEYQLVSLLKKYMFSNDMYTPQQLIDSSKKKFLENQVRLLERTGHVPTDATSEVLSWARGWIWKVLREFDPLRHLEKSAFGYRATVGVPMRKACESARLDGPISGSRDHITWFDKIYLSYHGQMREYLYLRTREGERYQECDVLDAVLVPKTWKALRMIMPNTTIGSLYSSGLGKLIEEALRRVGYDIRSLQKDHRDLAQSASLTGELVTADQSLASDNITRELCQSLLPRAWFDKIDLGRIEKMSLYGDVISTPTFMTMGIGFTFPLQTLIFLGLLKGCAAVSGKPDAKVSVYGDDLIYERSLHELVVATYEDLGLRINNDKTFSEGGFRESCGGDYFRSRDVRPWMISVDGADLSRRKYQAFLYKAINGLLRRWPIEEVPCTARAISGMITASGVESKLYPVPEEFPDTAGIRSAGPLSLRKWFPDLVMPFVDVHGTSRFDYLGFEPKYREELRHEPYLWNSLRKLRRLDPFSDNFRGGSRTLSRDADWDFDIPQPLPVVEVAVDGSKIRNVEFNGQKPDTYKAWFSRVQKTINARELKRWGISPVRSGKVGEIVTALTQVDAGRYRVQTAVTGHWT
jgi:hypothetical protein